MKKLLTLILAASFVISALTGCSSKTQENSSSQEVSSQAESSQSSEASSETVSSQEEDALVFDHTMELKYAENFKVDYFKDGYKLFTTNKQGEEGQGQTLLVVPEGKTAPEKSKYITEDTVIVNEPLSNVFTSSTSIVSIINSINALDVVSMTTYDIDRWYVEDVKNAMNEGKIKYVGDYKSPDYEIIASMKPVFGVASTMLKNKPEITAKLNELGLKLVFDLSSFEPHPMGRTEWLKFYGALFSHEEDAEKAFEEQCSYFENIKPAEGEKKTAAIFYITSKNVLYARKGGDYMAQMVEMAGGDYIFSDIEPDGTGTMKMDFENFYDKAKDADVIFYVWSSGGKPKTMEEFIAKNELFPDFKAVKENNVWFTTPDFFQINDRMGYMIDDISKVLKGETDDLKHLFQLDK